MNSSNDIPIQHAWRALFGTEMPRDPQTVSELEPEAIRRVFRRAARRCHPDLARSMGVSEDTLTARFQELQACFDALMTFAERGPEPTPRPASRPTPRARPAWPQDESLSHSGMHWVGGVPGRPLQLGRYLYYTGRISRARLKKALAWQQQQRPRLGALAMDKGLLGQLELGQIMSSKRMDEPIGQAAVRLGLLSTEMRDWLLYHQQRQQRPLGTYFVISGALSEPELQQALREHQAHNCRVASRS